MNPWNPPAAFFNDFGCLNVKIENWPSLLVGVYLLSAGYSFAKQKVMMKCCFSGGRTVTSFKHRISTTKWQERKRGNRKMNWTCKQKQECSISIHSLEATKITLKYMLFAFNEAQKLFLKNLLAERMWIFERLSCQNHQIPRRITQPKATYRVWKTWRAFLRGVRAQCPVRSRE